MYKRRLTERKLSFLSCTEYHSKSTSAQLAQLRKFLNARLSKKKKLFGDMKICMKIVNVDNKKRLKEEGFCKRLRFFDFGDVRCKPLQFLVSS